MDYLGKYKFKELSSKYYVFENNTYRAREKISNNMTLQRNIMFNIIDLDGNNNLSLHEFLLFVKTYKIFR